MSFRVKLSELMDKIGVGYVLGPYQTAPWSVYDSATGTTCSAEVRMGPDNDEIEAEAQLMYETPPAGKKGMEQACYIRATPASEGLWEVSTLRIRGLPFGQDIMGWQEKACDFFSLLIAALQADEVPDIDALLEQAFYKERGNDQYGSGGGKSPKIKPGRLMGMKKGGSM